ENIPFRHIDNKKWYVTGDLVSQDEDGFIFFKGRLKRFIKFGGEMISLPALEEAFSGILPPDEKGPMIAIEGIEKGNKKIICLFTRKEMEPMEANQILDAAGFRGIMRIDRVIKVNEIPLLGTGKTNYRKLKEQIEKESQEA
ncbi:2-acyl-glycerophospho-ethanolamine acyltransferase, partial [bacterium]|nr:2-acyl-glycerophospho-ethanolamine acyltransferase [bacterium]